MGVGVPGAPIATVAVRIGSPFAVEDELALGQVDEDPSRDADEAYVVGVDIPFAAVRPHG